MIILKKYYRKTFIMVLILSTLSIIVCPFIEGTSFAMKYVNALFSFSMLAIIVGGFLFVTGRGFFNVTKYGFKKVSTSNKKKELLLEESDENNPKDVLYERRTFSLTIPFLLSGILLVILSSIISIML
jgi:hypothetical protein